eukprot:196031_1
MDVAVIVFAYLSVQVLMIGITVETVVEFVTVSVAAAVDELVEFEFVELVEFAELAECVAFAAFVAFAIAAFVAFAPHFAAFDAFVDVAFVEGHVVVIAVDDLLGLNLFVLLKDCCNCCLKI